MRLRSDYKRRRRLAFAVLFFILMLEIGTNLGMKSFALSHNVNRGWEAILYGTSIALFLIAIFVMYKLFRVTDRERAICQGILDNLQEGVIACDREGGIIYTNPAIEPVFAKIQGKTKDQWLEAVGFYDEDGTPLAASQSPIARVLQGEKLQSEEMKIRLEDGAAKTVSLSGVPLPDGKGNIAGAILAFKDITQRNQAELELRAVLERYKSMAGKMLDLLIVADRNGNALLVNSVFQDLFGWDPERLIGCSVPEIVAGHEPIAQKFKEAFDSKTVQRFEYSLQQSDGSPQFFDIKISPLFSSEGDLDRIVLLARNVTEHKTALHDLLKKTRTLENAQRMGHIGNWELEYPSMKFSMSEELCRIHGFPDHPEPSLDDFINNTLPEDLERLTAAIQKAKEAGRPFDFYGRTRRPSGEIRHIHLRGEWVVNEEGQFSSLLGITHDITDWKTMQFELDRTKDQLQQVLDHLDIVLWSKDAVTYERNYVSPGVEKVYGVDREVFLHDKTFFSKIVHPKDIERAKDYLKVLSSRKALSNELRIVHQKTGQIRWIQTRFTPAFDAEGKIISVFGMSVDITERKRLEDLTASQNEVLRLIVLGKPLRQIMDFIATKAEAEFPNWHVTILLSEEPETESGESSCCRLYPIRSSDGQALGELRLTCETACEPQEHEVVYFKALANLAALAIEREESKRAIETLAYYDALTGLGNRRYFMSELERLIEEGKTGGKKFALLFLDMDQFKVVNDSLGHDAGDKLLVEIGRRLKQVGDQPIVARIGGDEFTLLMPELQSAKDVTGMAKKVAELFNESLMVSGYEFKMTPSIGISLYPDHGSDARELLRHADSAMYQAKAEGRNKFMLYDSKMNENAYQRFVIASEMDKSLSKQEFILHYQPRIELDSGEIHGFEALIRWQHAEKGLIPPSEFIPIAEETGFIVALGEWVLREACRQNKEWQEAGIPPVRVAVNVAAQQFRQPGFVSMVRRTLEEIGLEARWLEIEITESALMTHEEQMIALLGELSELGVYVSIDDFGTGYSSLSYLKRFKVNALKIDRSFIKDIPDDSGDMAITTTIIALAHSLGLNVTAEGAETGDQVEFLKKHGCNNVQGYYFGKPEPAGDAIRILNAY